MKRKVLLFQIPSLLLLGVFCLSLGCVGARSKQYYKGVGQLKRDMSQDEVRKIIGEPTGFHRRNLPQNELREIWVYHVKARDPRDRHFYPDIHLIVFSNGKMLAKDPHNPMAPRSAFLPGQQQKARSSSKKKGD